MTDPLVARVVAGLRQRQVPVSVAEVMDAHRGLAWVGASSLSHCRSVLRATLVKHAAHDPAFDSAFDEVLALSRQATDSFLPDRPGDSDLSASVAFDGRSSQIADLPDEAERVKVRDDRGDPLERGRLERADGPQEGGALGVHDVDPADVGRWSGDDQGWHRLNRSAKTDRCEPLEVAVRRAIDEVARAFLRRHRDDTRRFGPSLRGRLDVRATWRGARATGGVPLMLRRRGRVRRSTRVLVLVDVSVSVRPTAVLALHVADALARNSRGVRLLMFVDHAVEATSDVRRLPPERAVAAWFDGDRIDLGAASDYGLALRSARDLVGSWLDRHATVLVFGDGRSNGNDPGFGLVENLVRRVVAVHWCTPEPVGAWGLGFSEMQGYAERVTSAHHVRSLSDVAAALGDGVRPIRPDGRIAPRRW